MIVYDELKRQAATLSLEEFSRRFVGLYLVGSIRELKGVRSNFKTRQMLPALGRGDAMAEQRLTEERRAIWRLEKGKSGDRADRISVGRAQNNDVVIRHHQVSKRHAYFEATGGAPGEPGSVVRITDAGSFNGTRVNGMSVGPEESVEIRSGDWVSFGGMDCHLWDAAGLFRVLRSE